MYNNLFILTLNLGIINLIYYIFLKILKCKSKTSLNNLSKLHIKSVPLVKVFLLLMNPLDLYRKNSKELTFKTLLKTEEDIEICFSQPLESNNSSQVLSSKRKLLNKATTKELILSNMLLQWELFQESKLIKDWVF